MHAMVYTKPGMVESLDVDAPEPQPGEILIDVAACGICGSELHGIVTPGFRRPPLIMGHEFSGIDPGGRRVTVNPLVSCNRCDMCLAGKREVCRNRRIIGVHRPGAFAQQVAVPEQCVYDLPTSVSLEAGALIEPLANGVHAWRLGGGSRGSRVAVLGAGTIGLVTMLVAKHHGAEVSVVDLAEDRLAVASSLGADRTCGKLEGEFDVVIDAVGAPATHRSSIERLRPAGAAIWIGLSDSQASFDALDLVRMEKRIVGSYGYSNEEFTLAIELASQVDLGWSTPFDLSEGPTIFAELMGGRSDVVKALLRPVPISS